jgi:RHS repeat-associated protein
VEISPQEVSKNLLATLAPCRFRRFIPKGSNAKEEKFFQMGRGNNIYDALNRISMVHRCQQSTDPTASTFDALGRTLTLTLTLTEKNGSGTVISAAIYSVAVTPFRYNGQAGVITEKNGLLHMRARYYSPFLMRFLNADPIGFSGGSNC